MEQDLHTILCVYLGGRLFFIVLLYQ